MLSHGHSHRVGFLSHEFQSYRPFDGEMHAVLQLALDMFWSSGTGRSMRKSCQLSVRPYRNENLSKEEIAKLPSHFSASRKHSINACLPLTKTKTTKRRNAAEPSSRRHPRPRRRRPPPLG